MKKVKNNIYSYSLVLSTEHGVLETPTTPAFVSHIEPKIKAIIRYNGMMVEKIFNLDNKKVKSKIKAKLIKNPKCLEDRIWNDAINTVISDLDNTAVL